MPFSPNHPNIAADLLPITVSVSSAVSASVKTGYRGLFIHTTTSLTICTPGGTFVTLDALQKNTFFWAEIAFVSIVATATSTTVYGVI